MRLERAKEAGKTAETGKSANAGKLAESAAGVVVEVGGALVRVERGFDPELLRGVFEVLSGKGAS